jgi:hypothetical protein
MARFTGTNGTDTYGRSYTAAAAATLLSGSTMNIAGNATTATTLQTARTINGVSFNGSANITVADATKLPLTGGALSGNLDVNADINGVNNIYLATNLYHEGDTDTALTFGTNTITLATGGSAEITVDTTGVRLGDTGNGYFQPVTGTTVLSKLTAALMVLGKATASADVRCLCTIIDNNGPFQRRRK